MSSNLVSKHGALWWIVTGIGLCAAGCGDNTNERLDDVPLACTPDTAVYRIDHVDPSAQSAETIDVDGDGSADNSLGRAYDFLASIEPTFAVTPRFDAVLATKIPWLVAVERCSDEVRISVERGVPLGDEPLLPRLLPRAVGTIEGDTFDATDGIARLPLTALADANHTHLDAGWREADGLSVHATIAGDTLTGVFAAALPTEIVRADLASPIADFLTAQPADHAMRSLSDVDHDGVVTADELAATTTFQAIIVSDVTIAELPATSVAFGFTATRIR